MQKRKSAKEAKRSENNEPPLERMKGCSKGGGEKGSYGVGLTTSNVSIVIAFLFGFLADEEVVRMGCVRRMSLVVEVG